MGKTSGTSEEAGHRRTLNPFTSVRGRIIAGFGLPVLILVGVVAGSAWLVREYRSDTAAMEEHADTTFVLQDAQSEVQAAATGLQRYVIVGDETQVAGDETLIPEIRAQVATAQENLARALAQEEMRGDEEKVALLREISIGAAVLVEGVEGIIARRQSGDVAGSVAALEAVVLPFREFESKLDDVAEAKLRDVSDLRNRAERTGDLALSLLVVSGAGGAVLGLVASAFVARSIIRPLSSLEATAMAVSRGDLNARAQATGPRELVRLSVSLNRMTESLLDASKRRELEAERRRAFAQLRKSEERYRGLVETSPDAITLSDLEAKIVMVNQQAVKLHACKRAEQMLGRSALDFVSLEDRQRAAENIRKALGSGGVKNVEYSMLRVDGTSFPAELSASLIVDAEGKPEFFIAVVRDISDRKRAVETIRHMAYHDALTNLPNRALLKDRLTLALAQARRDRASLALMFLDLDRLKVVNDTAGHSVGDELLRGVARRLTALVREGDTVARVSGDEFAILLPGVSEARDAAKVADKILAGLQRPFCIDGQDLHSSASIGISFFPEDGEDAETLLRNADMAMYRAKEMGRNNYQLYTPAMNAAIRQRLTLENDLRRALENDEFVVYYQPQVSIGSGRIVGVEALVRWQHPDRGLVLPGEFIPVAEETGLIVPLGEWVLRKACAQNKAWQDAGFRPLRVAVNLSARQFQQRNLISVVGGALEETGLNPRFLQLEITEGIAMQDADFTVTMLQDLTEMGVQIVIDDFGTGYSSLSYLKRFPISAVKIDRSFVKDLTADANDAAIAATIITMAHTLKLTVIAEGVETEEQLKFLGQRHCNQFQGFLCSKPVPPHHLERMLGRGKLALAPGSKSRASR